MSAFHRRYKATLRSSPSMTAIRADLVVRGPFTFEDDIMEEILRDIRKREKA